MEMKHAILSCQTGWLQNIGKVWLESGVLKQRLGAHSRSFCQNVVGSDMVRLYPFYIFLYVLTDLDPLKLSL